MQDERLSAAEIAALNALRTAAIERAGRRGWPEDDRATVAELIRAGETHAVTALIVGRTRTAVAGLVHRMRAAGGMMRRQPQMAME